MMIQVDKIEDIKSILRNAAQNESTVAYSRIYQVFDEGTDSSIVWETFEEACGQLADSRVAIYGALLATKATGLPQNGFFDVFMNMRNEEYIHITRGEVSTSSAIPFEMREAIVASERERVYAHCIS
ncbi:hypothetical protein [Vibrio hyugaensis]|uniref:hypothetical protein n=1 Tax=Vibrio hyugaensis TaxID=1534743 RepID=UPI0005EE4F64|nr:hypothetical protein [Vibrio hyugaensis]